MRRIQIGIIVVFCGLLSAMSLVTMLKPENEYSEKENRILETKPEFLLEDVLTGDYQECYESYLNDQFFARDIWVNTSVKAQRLLGKSDINQVYLGADGYLIEEYTDADFDEELIENNIFLLTDFMNRMTEEMGSEHVLLMMVPGKANALPDKLPVPAVPYDTSILMDEISDNLQEPEELLDLTDTMRAHGQEEIYYRTDHHWTTLGAYYAYEQWAVQQGIEPNPLEFYDRELIADEFYGTTYNKICQAVQPDHVELFHQPVEAQLSVDKNDGEDVSSSWYQEEAIEGEADKYRIFFGGNTAKIVISTAGNTGKRLLVLKDSYANCLVPFLAPYYDEIVMIDLRYQMDLIGDILQQEKAFTDVLLCYNMEKLLQDEKMDLLAQE